ncbi:hypothetical protein JOQ06_014639 [Pogonophryne albipinna]|uniref:Uncharacterized protein n=1 Tax=Pogonophryne albipinna TaxID=1090488 RepID=A0AAD6FAM4_9TELE|nr:hypothetical protein JOQ06_014639 [Pogonophryne albipinna]
MDNGIISQEGASLLVRPAVMINVSLKHLFPPLFFPRYLSSPVSELSLADAPDGSIILEHLSAVCLHHGSSAATGAKGK